MNSKFGELVKNDYVKGAVIAVVSAVISTVIQGLQVGAIDWAMVVNVSSIAFLSYLLKNLATEKTPTTETVVGIKLDTK